MKNKINIFSDKKIKSFLIELFSDYELFFIDLNEVHKYLKHTGTNIIFLNDRESTKLIDFKKLTDNFLIFSDLKNTNQNINNQLIKIPKPINNPNCNSMYRIPIFKCDRCLFIMHPGGYLISKIRL